MNRIEYIAPLRHGYHRMVEILFRPFDFAKWLTIGLACWLVRLADGGNLPFSGGAGGGGGSRADAQVLEDPSSWWERIDLAPLLLIPLGLILLFALAALVVLLLWLSSRGEFIFLDNVVRNRGAIQEPWSVYRTEGNSLFFWQLGYVAVTMVLFLLFGAPAAVLAYLAGEGGERSAAIGMVIVMVLGLVILVIGALYVRLWLRDFVVPIMFVRRLRATEAWKVFLEFLGSHAGPFLLYGLFKLGLWLLVGAGLTTVIFLTCCLAAIPLVIPYVGTVVLLPVFVTFRAMSVAYLEQLMPELELLEPARTPAE